MIAPLLAAALQAATLPDIALDVRVDARLVEVREAGEARLTVGASPDGGSVVNVEAPRSEGRRSLRNVSLRVRGEARIAPPRQNRGETETPRR